MSFSGRWKYFAHAAVAVAFDRERLWSVSSPDGEVHATAAWAAVDRRRKKLVAVGDEALRLRGTDEDGLVVSNYIREGGITAFDVAEAALARELRKRLNSIWRLAPRVVVATPQGEVAKRAMRDALVRAGARDIITIPTLMAGALGAGLDVAANRPSVIFMLDRDWAGFAVVQSNLIVASSEGAGGVEQMLEDVAARGRPVTGSMPDLDTMHAQVLESGFDPSAKDGGHELFFLRWRARFLQATQNLPLAIRHELERTPLCFAGPYAKIPGFLATLGSVWEGPVILAKDPERVAILGCRQVLGKLDQLMKSLK